MGTGTSFGVPVIACRCHVCMSGDTKDKRNRCSCHIVQTEDDGSETSILIDVPPEFRQQALRYNVNKLSAVLITHSHADHVHGLDDLRVFSHKNSDKSHTAIGEQARAKHKSLHSDQMFFDESAGAGLKVYANDNTCGDLRRRFDYVFSPYMEGGGIPKLDLQTTTNYNPTCPLQIGSLTIVPIPLLHGTLHDSGYMISHYIDGIKHSFLYLTDCSTVPQTSLEIIHNSGGVIDHLVLDALRKERHSTHLNFDAAIEVARCIKAAHTWFTHICHDASYVEINAYIKKQYKEGDCTIESAFDGLEFEV